MTREEALKEIGAMPKNNNYQLLRMPVNKNFAYYHKKNGSVVGMSAIHHEHFHFKDKVASDD